MTITVDDVTHKKYPNSFIKIFLATDQKTEPYCSIKINLIPKKSIRNLEYTFYEKSEFLVKRKLSFISIKQKK